MSFTRVAAVGELKPGQARSIRVGTRRIAVWNVDGEFFAIDDACKHMKAPLSTGRLSGTTVTCSWHGWKYDVTTGQCHDKQWGCVRTYPVKIEQGAILVSDVPRDQPGTDDEAGDDPDDFPMPVFRS